MSNVISLNPIEFTNARTGIVCLGYTAYDDHGSAYCNLWENIPDDDMEFLEKVVETCLEGHDDSTLGMLTHVCEHECDIEIGQTSYKYSQIKDIIQKLFE